jgi:hypothetical protein
MGNTTGFSAERTVNGVLASALWKRLGFMKLYISIAEAIKVMPSVKVFDRVPGGMRWMVSKLRELRAIAPSHRNCNPAETASDQLFIITKKNTTLHLRN